MPAVQRQAHARLPSRCTPRRACHTCSNIHMPVLGGADPSLVLRNDVQRWVPCAGATSSTCVGRAKYGNQTGLKKRWSCGAESRLPTSGVLKNMRAPPPGARGRVGRRRGARAARAQPPAAVGTNAGASQRRLANADEKPPATGASASAAAMTTAALSLAIVFQRSPTNIAAMCIPHVRGPL